MQVLKLLYDINKAEFYCLVTFDLKIFMVGECNRVMSHVDVERIDRVLKILPS
jgi:hypothetical protein